MAVSETLVPDRYADNDDDDYNEAAPLTGGLVLIPSSKTSLWQQIPAVRFSRPLDGLGALKRFIWTLVPSFFTSPAATTPSKSGIAALDGLRGLACLFVFNEHYVICYQSRETQIWLMRVPFIRLFWYGKAAVFLFFVISGYVLSCKPLKLMRARSYSEFQKVMSSSFFRRGMRLYVPCLVVSFIVCGLTHLGIFDRSSEIYNQYQTFVFLKEEPPPRLGLYEQIAGYLKNVEFIFSATIPFDKSLDVHDYFVYDDHQWTIPREFQSSMVIFATLITTSRMRSIFRIPAVVALACYAVYTSRLYISLFFAGMALAELDLVRQRLHSHARESLPEYADEKAAQTFGVNLRVPDFVSRVFWISLFTLGVFMISSPQEIQQTPNFLPSLLRQWGIEEVDDTLLLIGSICVVWSVAACPSLAPLFNNPVVCYLGKISYALYLVHGTVIKSLGYALLPWTLRLATGTPKEVELNLAWWQTVPGHQKVVAHVIGWCFVGTTCFWLSDLFWRFVDVPCVSCARTIENWVTEVADDDPNEFVLDPCSVSKRSNPLDHRRRAMSMGPSAYVSLGTSLPEQSMLSDGVQGSKRKNG